MCRVDQGQLPEFLFCQMRFVSVEASATRLFAQTWKTARTVSTSPFCRGRTRIVGPCLGLRTRVFTGVSSAPPRTGLRSVSAIRTAEADDAFLAIRDVGVHRIQTSIGRDPLMYGFAANGTRSLFEEAG